MYIHFYVLCFTLSTNLNLTTRDQGWAAKVRVIMKVMVVVAAS